MPIDCFSFHSSAKRIHSLPPEDNSINGLTILNDELFVFYAYKPTISVYNKDTFILQRTLSVPGLGGVAVDMVSCRRHQCVYISDSVNNVVHRVDNVNQIAQWPVHDTPSGLSINSASNVLVTCDEVGKVKEFTTYGKLMREIALQSDITHPWQAIQLTNGQFVVCHGERNDHFNRVCIVNSDGNVLQSYGGAPGSGDGQLNGPYELIVNGFIFVTDVNNARVLMLSPSLKFVRQILAGPRKPLRMCFDEATGRLFVADCKFNSDKNQYVSGQVNIYSLCE